VFIIEWIEIPVSWVLYFFHSLLSPILGPGNGWTWVLSIVGLVIVIRILLIPLFVKQIKAQRNMQVIQPRLKEIQKKYAGDRERQSQEMMKIYKETGTNPLSSCLPLLLQAPIFFALFRVLQYGIAQQQPVGALSQELVDQAHNATIFGVPLYATFWNAAETPNPLSTRMLTVVLIILMSATTFITQRQLLLKNTTADNPMARQMKILAYVFPIIFAVTGVGFPIGVLVYWFTTNVWTMGQQFWVIRNNPMPGTPAYDAHQQRKAEKAARKGGTAVTATVAEVEVVEETANPERVQPKRQTRSQRSGQKQNTGPKSGANRASNKKSKSKHKSKKR
jgi:YidC/Oxa1 family membrane protein insertase